MQRTAIILVDGNVRRRASVAFGLSRLGSYVIPLEDVGEIADAWPERAVILLEDTSDNIVRLVRMMRLRKYRYPFIAFSPEPSAQSTSLALTGGARAYLAWPSEPDTIIRAIAAICPDVFGAVIAPPAKTEVFAMIAPEPALADRAVVPIRNDHRAFAIPSIASPPPPRPRPTQTQSRTRRSQPVLQLI